MQSRLIHSRYSYVNIIYKCIMYTYFILYMLTHAYAQLNTHKKASRQAKTVIARSKNDDDSTSVDTKQIHLHSHTYTHTSIMYLILQYAWNSLIFTSFRFDCPSLAISLSLSMYMRVLHFNLVQLGSVHFSSYSLRFRLFYSKSLYDRIINVNIKYQIRSSESLFG